MHPKTVLIVEDVDGVRLGLQMALQLRGFNVKSAKRVSEARRITRSLGEQIDVMLLDMRLEDPVEMDLTGAEVALEYVEKYRPAWRPEFIIFSVYAEVAYYKLALRLGAAAYLSKGDFPKPPLLIPHIRALALRRALSMERPDAAVLIHSIAETSRNRTEAVSKFCKEMLNPEFSSCLGTQFFFLLTNDEGTSCVGGNAGLPEGSSALYETLQALANGEANQTNPFVLDIEKLGAPTNQGDYQILSKLHRAAFLPLSVSHNLRLTVGLISEDKAVNPLAEDVGELAKVLGLYFRPTIIELLLNILSQWAELSARRKAILKATSQFCLYVGQEQLSILSDAGDSEGDTLGGAALHRLQLLAEDLRDTGQILVPLGEETGQRTRDTSREPAPTYSNVPMAELVMEACDEVRAQFPENTVNFEVGGDCVVRGIRSDLFIAVSRLIQWLAQRSIDTNPELQPLIMIVCEETPAGPRITFRDRSRRLSQRLRQRLFFPFAQSVSSRAPETEGRGPGLYLPLYLAKMLVEMKHNGELSDHSDELESNAGHKFVMSFPQSVPAVAVGAGAA